MLALEISQLQYRPNDLRENSIVFGAKPETTTVPPPEETAKPFVEPYLLQGDVRELNIARERSASGYIFMKIPHSDATKSKITNLHLLLPPRQRAGGPSQNPQRQIPSGPKLF